MKANPSPVPLHLQFQGTFAEGAVLLISAHGHRGETGLWPDSCMWRVGMYMRWYFFFFFFFLNRPAWGLKTVYGMAPFIQLLFIPFIWAQFHLVWQSFSSEPADSREASGLFIYALYLEQSLEFGNFLLPNNGWCEKRSSMTHTKPVSWAQNETFKLLKFCRALVLLSGGSTSVVGKWKTKWT